MAEINLFRNEPTRRELESGETLFEVGDEARHLFAVLEGAVEIIVDGAVREVVGPGGIVGEMGLLVGHVRTATARATEPSVVAEIDDQRFLALVKMNPFFALEVMRVLAERLDRENRAKD